MRKARHHRRGGNAIPFAGEAQHRHADLREVGAFVERHEAAQGGAVGVRRHGAHDSDGPRPPARVCFRGDQGIDQPRRQSRHGATGIERLKPLGFWLDGRPLEQGALALDDLGMTLQDAPDAFVDFVIEAMRPELADYD